MRNSILLLVICLAAYGARGVSIVTAPGNPYQISGLSTDPSSGLTMSGMQVWAQFSDGSTQVATWGHGGATVPSWFSISVLGNTFTVPWSINNLSAQSSIVSFGFLGAPGAVVFDKAYPGFGTLDSGNGLDLAFYDNRPATVIYSDIVSLAGNSPVGDLYASMKVVLDNDPLLAGSSVKFRQDTDSAIGTRFIPRVPDLGSTALLLSMGLAGVFAIPRRWA